MISRSRNVAPPLGDIAATCDAGLRRGAARVYAVDPAHWQLDLGRDIPSRSPLRRVEALLEPGWMRLEACWSPYTTAEAWSLLALGASLPRPCKLAPFPNERVGLCCEVPLCEELEAREARVALAVALFASAATVLVNQGSSSTAAPVEIRGRSDGQVGEVGVDAREVLAEAGWTCSAEACGDLAVRLELRGRPVTARLRCDGAGLQADVDVLSGAQITACQRDAIGALLFSGCGAVRWARGTVCDAGSGATVRFEVGWPQPSASDVVDALGSLSAATSQFAPEVQALAQDESLARAYVDVLRAG